jgi:hypothetical protein
MRSPTVRALVALVLGSACSSDAAPIEPPTTGSIQLASNVLGASVVQGYATTVDLTLSRTGGFAGAVTLSAEGLPANVTASFAPATLTGATVNSTVTLQVGANATLGAAEVTLRASGDGVTSRTVRFELTVLTPPLAVVAPAAAIIVSRGSSATIVVRVVRTNFTAPFALTVEDLPTGITAVFSPATVSDSSALLTITAAAGAALGAGAFTVRANGGGVANATGSIPFTVGAAGAGASLVWRFCDVSQTPVFFAFRDGTAGPFVRVPQGANRTFSYALSGNAGAVAYVVTANGYPDGTVHYATATELAALGTRDCFVPPSGKTLTFPFAGLGDGAAIVRLGYSTGGDASAGQTSLTLDNIAAGTVDLLATRYVLDAQLMTSVPDRYILRRGVNYAAGSTIPTLDFGSAEAFTPVAATITLANLDGGAAYPYHYLVTPNGRLSAVLDRPPSGSITDVVSYVKYGLPAARLQPGEFHQLDAFRSSIAADDYRSIVRYDVAHVDRTLTFGPPLITPSITTLGTAPYVTLRAAGTWQPEYEGELVFAYGQAGTLRNWTLTGTRAYAPVGATYAFDLPDLSTVAGFDSAWGLAAGAQTSWYAIGRSPSIPVPFDGATVRTATRPGALFVP